MSMELTSGLPTALAKRKKIMPEKIELPETVNFTVDGLSGVKCVAAVMFKTKYLLNMGTCIINFADKPKVSVEYLPHSARLSFNDGAVWFDVDGQAAAQIEKLFE